MNQLSGFLKLEVSKYKDIDHILKKLEDDGEIPKMYQNFKEIFDNEFKFTFQELLKIQEAKKESLDIKRQCENNLSLFKNNLVLIVQMIIEKALKNTISENGDKFGDTEENTTYVEESTLQASHQVSPNPNPIHISPIRKGYQTKPKPRNSRGSNSKDKLLNLSSDTKGSVTPYLVDRKLNLSQLSTSKIDSPLSQILHATHSPQRSKDTSSFVKDKSSTQQPQYFTPRTGAHSLNSFRHESSLNESHSFVHSEFNHIRGHAKFSKSPKNRDIHNLSPGPGSYKVEKSSLRQSPSPKIGKAMKISWFDSIVTKNESPGPYLYPSKHFLSK